MQSRTDKSADRAKRHLRNITAHENGKPHKARKKVKKTRADIQGLLHHNEQVAKINSAPPVFVIWDRSYMPKCSAPQCTVINGMYN